MKVENSIVYYNKFSDDQINYVCNFFDRDDNLKS